MKKFILPFLLAIPAKRLAGMAFIIWLCSLPLTGIKLYFHIYAKEAWIYGYNILATGWLSPFVGNFAWFANLFFLYGVVKLRAGKPAITSSIIAAILSLDTFRFDQLLMNAGGSTAPVYGYGWGAVLWFLSLYLLMVAAGKREVEIAKESNKENQNKWLQSVGLILLGFTICTAGYFAIYDRITGNKFENQRLAGIAFKRGKICQVELTDIAPISNFSGPLELVIDEKEAHADYYAFQPKELLRWGILTVRFKGYDYFLDNSEVISTRAVETKPMAILKVTEHQNFMSYGMGNSNNYWQIYIHATLVETATNRTVFDQTWGSENLHGGSIFFFCPDYKNSPNEYEQPRRLLIQALNLK